MPQFLIPIISGIGWALAGTTAGFAVGATMVLYAAELASAALLLGGLAFSSAAAKKAKRRAKDAFNASQVDRLVNVSSPVAPRDLVLGRVRKGGAVFFKASTGTNKATFCMCIALAGHEIDAVEDIWFNDVKVTLDGSGNVTSAPYATTDLVTITELSTAQTQTAVAGSQTYFTGISWGPEGDGMLVGGPGAGVMTTYQYAVTSSNANVRTYLGTPTQTADARLMALFPALWTSAHRARGVAYLICEFQYSESSFPTGIPNVTATIRGAKVYDPRTTTTVWSQNPALMARHVYQHAKFGKATVTAAEDARVTTAANACDVSHGYVVSGVTTNAPMYQAALVVPFGADASTVIDDLCQAMAGSKAFMGGELYIKAGVYTGSVMSLTDADLAVVVRADGGEQMRPVSISVHKERSQKFNVVNIQIWDKAQDYKQVALTPLKGTALITRDGAELAQGITYPAIFHAPQALHVGGVMMRDARDPLTVQIPFKLRAYPLELFDTVDITLSRYGWTSKLFQVLGREWTAQGDLQLTLKETAASIYTPDASFSPQGFATNTGLPSPWYVPTIGTLTVSSGTTELLKQSDGTILTRMRVSWGAIDNLPVTQSGTVEVQYRSIASTGEWTSVSVSGAETQVVITGVQDRNVYNVRARGRTSLAVGLWGVQATHQVVGKTEPPPAVAALYINGNVLRWTPVSAPDLSGYRLRYLPGTQINWAGGSALHQGTLTGSPYTMETALPGTVTYMVVAVDTSGNESSLVASVQSTGTLSLAGNTLESYPQAPLFEGTISAGTISAGTLLANGSGTLYWGAASNLHWSTDSALYWGATSYVEMVYSFAVGVSSAGTLAIDSDIFGSVVTLQMLRSGLQSAWTNDAATYWVSDPAVFWSADTSAWEPWPGQLTVAMGEYIGFRVTTSAGPTQGQINLLTPYLDVATVEDYIDNASIDVAGTRLTLGHTFKVIKSIQLTVQQDGGSAITARWVDKDTAGPLVFALNNSGAAVAGTLDAYLKGY